MGNGPTPTPWPSFLNALDFGDEVRKVWGISFHNDECLTTKKLASKVYFVIGRSIRKPTFWEIMEVGFEHKVQSYSCLL